MNEQFKTKTNTTNSKTLTQQIFHKGLFQARPRTLSLGDDTTSNANQAMQITDCVRDESNRDETWTQISRKRRPLSSPESNETQKQSKLDTYWLSQNQPVPTSNRFANLENEDQHVDKNDTAAIKLNKPPPIFVDKVGNIQPLLKTLNEHAQDMFSLKILSNDQVKIQPKDPDTYRIIVHQLELRNTEFFTYKSKNERSFKVILKNMHASTDPEDIKEALYEMGHISTNIWNIKQRTTKKPLPMFVIELKANDNNKSIYVVKQLLNCIVTFEPPRPKRELPQCAKCQQYGHTKTYCRRAPKCIKCAGDHLSRDCPRKSRSDSVKCVLCDGNHPANYKGCKIYRELQSLKFPKTAERRKTYISRNESRPRVESMSDTNKATPNNQPTYKDALNNKHKSENTTSETKQTNQNDMHEIMSLMKQMTQQLTTLTNLIIALTAKLTNSTV